MFELNIGDKAPDFNLPRDGGNKISLSDYRGQNVILYFYPKDNTPGCTTESCDFRDNLPGFEALDAQIIGISKDSAASHDKFRKKHNLNFPLASDEESNVCETYGVWKEKNMYGKKFMGIERSTFLIDSKGTIRRIWRKVKVKNHCKEVLAALEDLKKAA